jgi:ABC-type uncharacterized transport system permease subunit
MHLILYINSYTKLIDVFVSNLESVLMRYKINFFLFLFKNILCLYCSLIFLFTKIKNLAKRAVALFDNTFFIFPSLFSFLFSEQKLIQTEVHDLYPN